MAHRSSILFVLFLCFAGVVCADRSNEILQRTLLFESNNYPHHYWNLRGNAAYIDLSFDPLILNFPGLTVVSGLHGTGVSFRTSDGRYLRHRGYWIYADKYENSALFKLDASFYVENGIHDRNGYSFRSVNFPEHFIRHTSSRLRIDLPGIPPFAQDATFYARDFPKDLAKSIIGRQVRFESDNFRSFFMHARFDRSVYIDRSPAHAPLFKIVPGLKGQGVSFQAFDGSYLRHSGYVLWAHHDDASDLFKKDATFLPLVGIANRAHISFRSYNFPRHYIRHAGYRVQISDNYNAPFDRDATWLLV